MGIHPIQFKDEIIEPTLQCMGRVLDPRMYSKDAVLLLLETASSETQLSYLKQYPSGPGLGFYSMEPATYADIKNWIDLIDKRECEKDPKRDKHKFRNDVIYCVYQDIGFFMPDARHLIYNLRLQTVFARLHYWRVKDPIPEAPQLRAQYWKDFYNTKKGAGTVSHYINSIPNCS